MSANNHFSTETIERVVSRTKAMKEALPHLQDETFWVYDFKGPDGELAGLIVIDGGDVTTVKHSMVKICSAGGCSYGENARKLLAKWRKDARE